MFLSGHDEIFEDICKELPKDYFKLTDKYIFFNKEKIIKGIQYIDLPCGIYELTKNKKNLIFHSKTLCNSIKILNIINDVPTKNNNTIFQHHRGYFAHLHSMTTDPENTNRKIRNKIILTIIGYALLAVYDDKIYTKTIYPNAMWIGFIIHIITDSYSPSHTIRSSKLKYKIVNKPSISKEKEYALKQHEYIKRMAKKDKLYTSIKFNNKLQYDAYKLLKFEFDINKISKRYVKNNLKETLKYYQGDIISFQYSLNQPLFMHQSLDLLYNVKNNKKIYRKMINECKELLIIYKKALITKNIKKYIYDILNLLLNKTFRMTTDNLESKSNKIYNYYDY